MTWEWTVFWKDWIGFKVLSRRSPSQFKLGKTELRIDQVVAQIVRLHVKCAVVALTCKIRSLIKGLKNALTWQICYFSCQFIVCRWINFRLKDQVLKVSSGICWHSRFSSHSPMTSTFMIRNFHLLPLKSKADQMLSKLAMIWGRRRDSFRSIID